jgi:hypothetical protein
MLQNKMYFEIVCLVFIFEYLNSLQQSILQCFINALLWPLILFIYLMEVFIPSHNFIRDVGTRSFNGRANSE